MFPPSTKSLPHWPWHLSRKGCHPRYYKGRCLVTLKVAAGFGTPESILGECNPVTDAPKQKADNVYGQSLWNQSHMSSVAYSHQFHSTNMVTATHCYESGLQSQIWLHPARLDRREVCPNHFTIGMFVAKVTGRHYRRHA